MKAFLFFGLLISVQGQNTTVEIFATHSTNFDVRQQPEKPVDLAKCLIENCNLNLTKEEILFIIGQKRVEATEIEINEESKSCIGIFNFAPVAEDDEKWISCEVNKNDGELLKSNNCFNLDVKHTARSINLELSNVMKSGNATLVLAGTRLGVKCLTDGNPREKTQVTVNGKRPKGRFFNVKKENLIIECSSKSLSTLEPVRVIYLNEPKITTKSTNQTTCSADGYPRPSIKWLKLPEIGQRVFKMRSESTRTRKWLRKWEYDIISDSSSAFLQQDQIYICNVENEYLSMSKLFRAEKKAGSAQTDLIIQPEIRRRKEASRQSPCANSICNIPMKKSMLVSCSKPYYESSESDALELVLDGYLLEPNENRRSSKVVAKMELPMKKEGLIRRKKSFFPEQTRKSCAHRLACCSGDDILNSVDIVQNFLKKPIIAFKRHNIYRQTHTNKIRRRIGSFLDLQCFPDSIPQSSIFWVREDRKKKERKVVGDKAFLYFSNITLEDSGIYTCTSSNSLGSRENSFKLKIH